MCLSPGRPNIPLVAPLCAHISKQFRDTPMRASYLWPAVTAPLPVSLSLARSISFLVHPRMLPLANFSERR